MKSPLYIALFAFFIALSGCQPVMEPYGEALSLSEITPIENILADPTAYVGQKVRIAGQITDVCPMKGCWIEIETEDGQALIVKVDDGDIVFKPESKGKNAIAEGEVYSIEMDEERAIAYMEHLAEEKGEEFDPSTVEGPMTVYQIKGAGALVEE